MARPIRIATLDEAPLGEIRYLNAAPRGGTVVARLPIVRAAVGPLAEELDAIVACSDLQGIVRGAAPRGVTGGAPRRTPAMTSRLLGTLAAATLAAAALAACGAQDPGPGTGAPDAPAAGGDPQLPPQGHAELTAWLAAGHYQAWACEPAPHPARPPGAHGDNRICSNALLSATAAGDYPVGAASVKELYRSGAIAGYAVGIKVAAASSAQSWYWYEAIGASVVADGVGRVLCSDCHTAAPRDFVYTQVPPSQ